MKVIIEAGSSKTEARLINEENKELRRSVTSGINPITDPKYAQSISELTRSYKDIDSDLDVWYYGSGCISPEVNEKVKKELKTQLPASRDIYVYDDLTAAGRASCQHGTGLVCILGTGSIIGYYDGYQLTDKLYSGGHLLGDEGSGYNIGRTLMIRYLRGQLSDQDNISIESALKMSKVEFIDKLYKQENPRKYLASFSHYLHIISSESKRAILNTVIKDLIFNMILPMMNKYKSPIHFIGSVAFYFQKEIAENLKNFDIIAASFEQSAIERLVQYHYHE